MKYHILSPALKRLCDKVCIKISDQTISKEKLLIRLKEITDVIEREIKSDEEWKVRRKSPEYKELMSKYTVKSDRKTPRVLHGFISHGLGYDHINSSDMDDWIGF